MKRSDVQLFTFCLFSVQNRLLRLEVWTSVKSSSILINKILNNFERKLPQRPLPLFKLFEHILSEIRMLSLHKTTS